MLGGSCEANTAFTGDGGGGVVGVGVGVGAGLGVGVGVGVEPDEPPPGRLGDEAVPLTSPGDPPPVPMPVEPEPEPEPEFEAGGKFAATIPLMTAGAFGLPRPVAVS